MDARAVANYWERRYQTGGDSGRGSRGEEAAWKVALVNRWLAQIDARTAIDFGSGDGYLLALGMAAGVSYVGVEPSATARAIARHRLDDARIAHGDRAPVNFVEKPEQAAAADVALSIDVLFHLVDDRLFRRYLANLFSFAKRYVIVYGTNHDERGRDHVLHRTWTGEVERFAFRIVETAPHPDFKTGWLLERLRRS